MFRNIPINIFSFRHAKISYSQAGEDIIIQNIFHKLKIKNPTYMDIGCYHPYKISNTARLSLKGSKGVNVDANENVILWMKFNRPDDTNISVGVTEQARPRARFYVHKDKSLSSFVAMSNTFRSVQTVALQELFDKYGVPDLLSCDLEGMDEIALQPITGRPKVICVESNKFDGTKNDSLISILNEKGYTEYAFTGINSIMVLKSLLQ